MFKLKPSILVIRSLNHPFHVHGHAFQVVGMGQHPLGIPLTRHMVKHMLLTRSLPVSRSNDQETSPLKDTVSIPSRGFAIIRFRADNPGTIDNKYNIQFKLIFYSVA